MKTNRNNLLRFLVTITIVLVPFVLYPQIISADPLSSITDTLEDSRPSTDSNHTIVFTTPTGCPADDSPITVTFPSGFDLTSLIITDVDFNDGGGDATMAADCTGSEDIGWSISSQVMTFQICDTDGGAVAATSTVTIEIGDHASSGSNKIENHATPAVYDIDIDVDSSADTGTAQIVIVSTITAQVTITQSLSFTISAQTPAECENYDDGGAPNEITSTSTSVNFGDASANTFYDGCQELDVDTNAPGGYTVTVSESDQLNFDSNEIADGACDGGGSPCSETTEEDWATSSNNGFGYCMEDYTGNGATTADAGWGTNGCNAADTYFKIFPELNVDSPEQQTIMSSVDEINDVADIGYRVSAGGTVPAGVYTNNIIFVCTPTY